MALHCIVWNCIILLCIALHCIALYYLYSIVSLGYLHGKDQVRACMRMPYVMACAQTLVTVIATKRHVSHMTLLRINESGAEVSHFVAAFPTNNSRVVFRENTTQ